MNKFSRTNSSLLETNKEINFEFNGKKYKGFYAAKVNTDLLKNFNKLDLNFNNQVIAQKK